MIKIGVKNSKPHIFMDGVYVYYSAIKNQGVYICLLLRSKHLRNVSKFSIRTNMVCKKQHVNFEKGTFMQVVPVVGT
jgi:hypothetical protein